MRVVPSLDPDALWAVWVTTKQNDLPEGWRGAKQAMNRAGDRQRSSGHPQEKFLVTSLQENG